MNFVDTLKTNWGTPAMSSLTFLRAAATTAPIPEYREAAKQLLEYWRESVGDGMGPHATSWHTILRGQPHLEKVFKDFRLVLVPHYGAEGSCIRDYDIILQIHIPEGSPLPKSFDDIEPFLGGWKTGYRGTLEVSSSGVGGIVSFTAPLRFETLPGRTYAEARFSVPTLALDRACITFYLTTETGHWVEGVDIHPLDAMPNEWKSEHYRMG